MRLDPEDHQALVAQLSRAQRLGFVGGKGDLAAHIEHSLRFAPLVAGEGPALDLGSGGGLPGLVLAMLEPQREWFLVDSSRRRVDELELAASKLGLSQVSVRHGRAEDLARSPELRGQFTTVVARAFAPPAVTAECSTGFLAAGGHLVVSEPPEPAPDRWPPDTIRELGMEPVDSPPGFQICRQIELCPEKYPRRTGVPERKLLF